MPCDELDIPIIAKLEAIEDLNSLINLLFHQLLLGHFLEIN